MGTTAWRCLVVVACLLACEFPRPADVIGDDGASDGGVDASPAPDWVTRRGGTGDDAGVEVASTADGGVVMAGRFRGTMTLGGAPISAAGGFSAWIARYGADGSHRWSVAVGDGDTNVTGIAVDSDGAVYAFGSFTGPVNFGGGVRSASTGLYLVKLSATGGYQWDRVFTTDYAIPGRIALLGADRIAICGIVNNTPIDFGGGPLLARAINGYVAVFAASTGAHSWSKILTTGDDVIVVDLVDVGGDVVVIGDFGTTASLGGALLRAREWVSRLVNRPPCAAG